MGRDRDMGTGKGFAFVGFEKRAVARQAIEKVDRKGYVNFILSIQWSRKCFFFLLEMP